MTTSTATHQLTAGQHLDEGEQLLAKAADPLDRDIPDTVLVARAQGHFTAARLLLDAGTAAYANVDTNRVVRSSGLWDRFK